MFQQVVNALTLGSMYSIVALGFTLYFGTVGLINFAHGDLATLSGFAFLLVLSVIGLRPESIGLGSFAAIACTALIAVLLVSLLSERFLFRRLRGRPPIEGLIVSIALSMLLRESILLFYPNGGNPQAFPDPFQLRSIAVFGATISMAQLLLLAVCSALAVGFLIFVKHTDVGRTMRAVSQDTEAARMLGLRVNRTVAWAFALGALLAGAAGVLNGAVYGSIKFDMGVSLGVKGFVAATAGGLDNPRGAFIGGLLLAGLETAAVATLPGGSANRDIVAFGLLLIILLFRPTGLLGGATRG